MRAGDVVWNTLTGEKALLVESAEETGGARIVADFVVEEGGFVPGGEHVHDHVVEHFSVEQGQMAFIVDGHEQIIGPGDELTVRPGSWHRWWNAGEGEVRMRSRVEPALHFEEMILVIWGLCTDGHTNAKGQPSPLLGALFATQFRDEIRFRPPPQVVQRLLFPPLAAVARRRGLEKTLDRYLNPDMHPSAQAQLGRLPEHVMVRDRK